MPFFISFQSLLKTQRGLRLPRGEVLPRTTNMSAELKQEGNAHSASSINDDKYDFEKAQIGMYAASHGVEILMSIL